MSLKSSRMSSLSDKIDEQAKLEEKLRKESEREIEEEKIKSSKKPPRKKLEE